jgi:gliding motility-associated-like protein
VKGGNGANMSAAGVLRAGPGGGGGGGVSWIKQTILPAQLTVLNSGGLNGVCTSYANDPYGATAGQNGLTMLNVVTPTASTLFKPNIDSVRFSASTSACNLFNFSGLGYTNSKPITSWQWNFGDGANASTQNASHFYTGLQTYTVKLVVTDVNGCKDSITKSVTTTGVSVDAGLDTVYCSSGQVTRVLKGTGIGSFSWSPAQFLNNSSLQNPTASIAATTKFYLALTNAAGCTGIDSVTVVVNPLPLVKSISDTSICIGAPLALTTSGASAYSWTPTTSVNNSFVTNPLFIGNISQQVIVTGTASSGCSNKDTVMISVKPLPKVQTIADSIVCSNRPIILTTNGAQTYHWTPGIGLDNPNVNNPIFAGNAGNQYIVTGTSNGCVGMDTVNITVRLRNSLSSPTNGEFCIGKSVILDGNNGNTYVSYTWSPSASLSSNNIINPIATPSATTNYTLTVTDKVCNYDSIFTVRVTVNPLPDIEATKSNDITCALGSARLTATGGISYSWTPAASLNDASTATPTASPTSNTIYTVIGTNGKGCSNADTVTVYYKSELGGYNMPNTFTPNGDGTNECFGVTKWGEIRQLDFIVYDRWGTRIFETHNPNVCWDGRYKGVRADQGTYVFYVKAMLACGEITRKGNVLLIR